MNPSLDLLVAAGLSRSTGSTIGYVEQSSAQLVSKFLRVIWTSVNYLPSRWSTSEVRELANQRHELQKNIAYKDRTYPGLDGIVDILQQ